MGAEERICLNTKINDIITFLFKNIPYSEQTENAKLKVLTALTAEYEKRLEHETEIQALGYLMSQYGTLEAAVKLAGYEIEEIKKWSDTGRSKDLPEIKKIFSRARINIYIFSLSLILAVLFLFSLILDIKTYYILFLAAALLFAAAFLKTYKKYIKQYKFGEISYSTEAYKYMCDISDKYGKRMINGIVISTCIIIYVIFVSIVLMIYTHAKVFEAIRYIYGNWIFMCVVLYINIKNIMCKKCIDYLLTGRIKGNYKKHLFKILSVSGIYWLTIFMILILSKNRIDYLFNIFNLACAAYLLALLIYNVTLRKSIVFKNITVNIKRITVVFIITATVLAYNTLRLDSWLVQPYISTIPKINHADDEITYNEDTGVYTITSKKEDFKILQLTDIHLGGSALSASKDLKELKAVYKLIEHTEPDLIIVTGDLVFPMGIMSFSINNHTPVMQFASFMRNIGIPWAFVYGNHDTEFMATSSAEDLNELLKSISFKNSENLLYPYVQPDITGRSNQIIEIRNTDGTLNQALVLLDSNAYTGEGINAYDYIHDDQVEWYERNIVRLNLQENKTVSSMIFFHMPLQEYRDAYELYEKDSNDIVYFFGENGEKMIDKVCCSDYHSKLFDTAVRLGSTKAMFCGHDHYNNLSVEYRGIRLTYGMSIDYLAMPGIEQDTAQRGGTVITLHPDSDFDIEQIPLVNIE